MATDFKIRTLSQTMSHSGVKRTCPFALQMSAFLPKDGERPASSWIAEALRRRASGRRWAEVRGNGRSIRRRSAGWTIPLDWTFSQGDERTGSWTTQAGRAGGGGGERAGSVVGSADELGDHFKRIGLEAGPLSDGFSALSREAGSASDSCVETRHMRAVLGSHERVMAGEPSAGRWPADDNRAASALADEMLRERVSPCSSGQPTRIRRSNAELCDQ